MRKEMDWCQTWVELISMQATRKRLGEHRPMVDKRIVIAFDSQLSATFYVHSR